MPFSVSEGQFFGKGVKFFSMRGHILTIFNGGSNFGHFCIEESQLWSFFTKVGYFLTNIGHFCMNESKLWPFLFQLFSHFCMRVENFWPFL